MPEVDPASIFAPRFNALGAPWAATGSIASMIYGEIRMTQDIDIVILLNPTAIAALERVFPATEFPCPPLDVVQAACARESRGHFNLIDFESGYKADVYVSRNDPLHAWALRHRRLVEISGESLWLVPPEYVIIHKLEFYREGGSEKHVRDIRGVLAVTNVDLGLIEWECAGRGLTEVWRSCRPTG